MYKLYYLDPFTGKKLLYKEYTRLKDLKQDWSDEANRDYSLLAVKETIITNLPHRKPFTWNQIS